MSLNERLQKDMVQAMKAGPEGKAALAVIRMTRAALKNAEIEKGRELNEEEELVVLAREVKQRRDALVEFERGCRPDLVQATKLEISILGKYLPQQMGEGEITALVQQVIADTGATGRGDLGKVMKQLMPRLKGRADGRFVNEIVQRLLSDERP
ncbi:MAG TPA: GatB/YqeY domain-containing protein [Firmicutes bacterium]|jgi:uncharacterized protein YqeY|nr:GatB/YqeY domain-containing protein [Bacillota bacterium]